LGGPLSLASGESHLGYIITWRMTRQEHLQRHDEAGSQSEEGPNLLLYDTFLFRELTGVPQDLL
jgi:hypothetical protein